MLSRPRAPMAALAGKIKLLDSAALGLAMIKIAEGIYLSQSLGR